LAYSSSFLPFAAQIKATGLKQKNACKRKIVFSIQASSLHHPPLDDNSPQNTQIFYNMVCFYFKESFFPIKCTKQKSHTFDLSTETPHNWRTADAITTILTDQALLMTEYP